MGDSSTAKALGTSVRVWATRTNSRPQGTLNKWTDESDESDTTQDYQNQAGWREGCLAKRVAQHPLGLQDHNKGP